MQYESDYNDFRMYTVTLYCFNIHTHTNILYLNICKTWTIATKICLVLLRSSLSLQCSVPSAWLYNIICSTQLFRYRSCRSILSSWHIIQVSWVTTILHPYNSWQQLAIIFKYTKVPTNHKSIGFLCFLVYRSIYFSYIITHVP